MAEIVRKSSLIYVGKKHVWRCQLGLDDPYKQSLGDMTRLFREAKNDFPGIELNLENVSCRIFGDTWVPDSVGISFDLPAETVIPDTYLQTIFTG